MVKQFEYIYLYYSPILTPGLRMSPSAWIVCPTIDLFLGSEYHSWAWKFSSSPTTVSNYTQEFEHKMVPK